MMDEASSWVANQQSTIYNDDEKQKLQHRAVALMKK